MAYTFNQKNWVAGEVITANGVNRIEECLGHLVDEKQNILYFDAVPTAGSQNLVNSGGIYNALNALGTFTIDRRPTSDSRNAVQSRGIYEALLGKQDLLIFDSTPKSSSSNPVTSQGIYQALNLKQNNLTFDSAPISNSNNPVTSKGIYQALSLKQDNLTFDSIPDSGSNNPVTSSGIYRALSLKQNNLTFDSTPILNSSNPVTSEGIYISLQNLLGEVNNSLEEIELKIPNAQVQSDWEEEDTESKAYIKNRPIVPNSKQQFLLENIYSVSYFSGLGITLWHFKPSISTQLSLIVGKKYKIQINNNFYEEYFQYSTSNKRYYFVGSFTPFINTDEIAEKGFAIDFNKIDENSFIIKTIYFKESTIQKFSITINELLIGRQYLDMPDWSKELTKPTYTASEVGAIPITEKGIRGGVATLNENGIIPSSQLPAYVDTILEYNSLSNFPSVGESGKIYVALDTNKSYRWSGTQYIEISSSISLGEVQGTAYEGHKGKANAIAINNLQYEIENKQNNLINVPEISEIRPTDYIYIERNRTIYKILASKLGTFTPDESDPNAIETNDGNIITDENGNEIIIDTNTTDTVETNDGKIILAEDQRELNLG